MDLGLAGRTYLLTGASRGLGLAAAEVLVAEGATVVISARHDKELAIALERVGRANAVAISADLADPDAAERLVAGTVGRFGRLDGALISVGGPATGTPMSVTDEQWRASFESVHLGAVRMLRAVASAATVDPDAPAGSGASLVAVLSTSAKSPIHGLSASNGLRPGLAMLVKDFADELGPPRHPGQRRDARADRHGSHDRPGFRTGQRPGGPPPQRGRHPPGALRGTPPSSVASQRSC